MFDDVKTAKKGEKSGRFRVWPYRICLMGLIHYVESKYESFFLLFKQSKKSCFPSLKAAKRAEKTLYNELQSVYSRRENSECPLSLTVHINIHSLCMLYGSVTINPLHLNCQIDFSVTEERKKQIFWKIGNVAQYSFRNKAILYLIS